MSDWRQRAACRTADPELFFTDATTAEAKAVCMACPVRLICLDWAQNQNLKDGIWGGLTPRERDKEKRQRPRRPARCDMCGRHYQRRSPSQRYCGPVCAGQAHRRAQDAYDRRHKAARAEYRQRKQEAAA